MSAYVGMFEKVADTINFKKNKSYSWEDRAYLDNAVYDVDPGHKGQVNLPTGEIIKRHRKLQDGQAFQLLSPKNSKTSERRHTVAAFGTSKKAPGVALTEYDRPATSTETNVARLNTAGNIAFGAGAAGTLASLFIKRRRTRNKVLNLASATGIGGTLTSLTAHRYLTQSGEGAKDALRQVGTSPDASGKTKVKYKHYKDGNDYRIARQILRRDDSYNLYNEVFTKRPRYEVNSLVAKQEH